MSRPRRTSVWVVVLASAQFAACGNNPADATAERLHAATAPPDSNVSPLVITHEASRVIATWNVETMWSSPRYFAWVRDRLAGEFDPVETRNGVLLFRQRLPGDLYVLELRRHAEAAAGGFAARFMALPF